MRRPGMRRHGWKRMANTEARIQELARTLTPAQLTEVLARINDDMVRAAVKTRIGDILARKREL